MTIASSGVFPEPQEDCSRLDANNMDCLERCDLNLCPPCEAWAEWALLEWEERQRQA